MTFAEMVKAEVLRAREHHRDIQTIHEGYAVLLEEVDEFWAEVKRRTPDHVAILTELTQIGAMAQRVAEDTGLVEHFGEVKRRMDALRPALHGVAEHPDDAE